MADFKLRAPPRVRFHGVASFDGVFGVGSPVALAGDAVARAVGQAALLRGINLAGAGVASSQATAALLKGIRLSGAAQAGALGSAGLSAAGGSWNVGAISLLVGAAGLPAGQFAVSATGPASYVSGGVYELDLAGSSLAAGVTLTEAGVLDVGSASVGTVSNVVFAYSEPGANPTLTLHPTATGTFPYLATWCPPEGVVPSGYNAASPDDVNLRGSVISAWPDGSAKIIVLAGETPVVNGNTKGIRLRAGQPTGSNLTTARIAAIVSTVKVNFGAGVQTLTLSGATPDRTWWANPRVICARYRLACGVGALEAVIDIHAFAGGVSDRAFVEVVVENCAVNSASPSAPASQAYSGATVAVNDVTIATVSNPTSGVDSETGNTYFATAQHQPFRAWYCSTWVGGDPGIEVTLDAASMQAHPALFKCARASNQNFSTLYGSHANYTPWYVGDYRAGGMGGTGDSPQIGALTLWETRYLQSGDKFARRVVLANALAALSYNINYRDTGTGLVPTFDQTQGKNRSAATWPSLADTAYPSWETAHSPSVGLIAFLCRPSPCFIELAQKVAVWNCTWYDNDGVLGKFFQPRGQAWGFRALAHAIFLTPDALPWKSAAQSCLRRTVNYLDAWRTSADNLLNVVAIGYPGLVGDQEAGVAGFSDAVWQTHFIVQEMVKAAAAKVVTGSDMTALATFVDWLALQPVRYVNESTGGEWRHHRYETVVGRNNYDAGNGSPWGSGIYQGAAMNPLPTWGQQMAWYMADGVPSASGPWRVTDSNPSTYSAFSTQSVAHSGVNYVEHFWQALCMAIERGVPGADTAWSTVVGNVTGLPAWLDGFAADPRQGVYPRNKA